MDLRVRVRERCIEDEARRQETTLEMIASENFVPQSILECQGSVPPTRHRIAL